MNSSVIRIVFRAAAILAVILGGTQGSLAGDQQRQRELCVQRCVDHYGSQSVPQCQRECLREWPEED